MVPTELITGTAGLDTKWLGFASTMKTSRVGNVQQKTGSDIIFDYERFQFHQNGELTSPGRLLTGLLRIGKQAVCLDCSTLGSNSIGS